MGQFPAAALIYRLGLLDEAKPAVVVNRTVESVMNLEGVPINAVASQDANRAEDVPKEALGRVDTLESIDPRAFFVGKVCVNFTSNDNSQQMIDLKKYIDEKGKVITSSTGQLRWDYGNGLVKIMAPKAQAAVGFLRAAGAIDLPDVTVETPMEYAAVALVAMDGRPIATSTKLLLQVMTEQQNSGWDAPGTGLREIKSLGAAPIIVRQFAGTVKLKRADAVNLAVEALDANGVPVGQAGTAAGITLKPDVLYYLLHLLE